MDALQQYHLMKTAYFTDPRRTPEFEPLVETPRRRGAWKDDMASGTYFKKRLRRDVPEEASFGRKLFGNTVNIAASKLDEAVGSRWNPQGPATHRFSLNPFSAGSAGTYGDIGRRIRHGRMPEEMRQARDYGAASRAIQGRMRRTVAGAFPGSSTRDLSSVSGRVGATPDFVYNNPYYFKSRTPTVFGLDPTMVTQGANMLSRAVGLGDVLGDYSSRVPSVFPRGGGNTPKSMAERMGLLRYMSALTGTQPPE